MDLQNIFGLLKKLFISGSTNFLRLCSIYSCCSFLSNFTLILLYFICYCIECFGTDIFMSKIKSIKFLIFSCYLLIIYQRRHPSFLLSGEERGETVEFAARNYLRPFYMVSLLFSLYSNGSFFVVINRQTADFFSDSSSERPISITRNQEHRSKSRQNVNLCAHCFLSAAFLWHTSMYLVFVH